MDTNATGTKIITIFLASSKELESDRKEFKIFISSENDEYFLNEGYYLKIIQWEFFLDAISATRSQDEYNKAIRESDIVLCLFFTKIGKYTMEEFETAYGLSKSTGKPKIWIYFNHSQVNIGDLNTDELINLKTFQKRLNDLGYFPPNYTNISELKYDFRNQINKYLHSLEKKQDSKHDEDIKPVDQHVMPDDHNFNYKLTKKLIEAIRKYNSEADDLLTYTPDWETKEELISKAQVLINKSYVAILGPELRRLFSIGKSMDFSQEDLKIYLEKCQLTATRALQLISYALISKLWDLQRTSKFNVSESQAFALKKFFKNPAEQNIDDLVVLLKAMIEVFSANGLDLPLPELNDFQQNLSQGSVFMTACSSLDAITELVKKTTLSVEDCDNAEEELSVVLASLNFLAGYKMVSVKDIGFSQQRNDKEGYYLHKITQLYGDNPTTSIPGMVIKSNSPVITNAVLLYKEDYLPKNINMVPFIIDFNALDLIDGSRIGIYAFSGGNNVSYSVIEEDKTLSIKKSNTPKPDETDNVAFSEWWSDPNNRKGLNSDYIFNLFNDAQKTLAGF